MPMRKTKTENTNHHKLALIRSLLSTVGACSAIHLTFFENKKALSIQLGR